MATTPATISARRRDPDLELAIDGALESGLLENLARVRQQLANPPRNTDKQHAVKMHHADLSGMLRGYAERGGVSTDEFEALCQAEAGRRFRGRAAAVMADNAPKEPEYDRHVRLARECEWRIQTLIYKLNAARKDLVVHEQWLQANRPSIPADI
jgi:hypothetical protein